ncbi:MAG: phospholipase D family protein [Maribacter litoralis]|uniref:phospholipase D family protein n=1 Tax=Maribacter litoralis TaxID=2059726 RepID=UPI00329853FC
MSNFLTGDELENKLTDIIWNAKKHIVIISPFIKLDKHMKDVLDKIKSTHEISVFIVFGKNEEYKYKSFNEEDFQFFKEFKNITILYNKNLHAKHYCNENEGLITSLNLYGYSMVNNVEYGVHFSKNLLNPLDKLFEETEAFTYDLVYKQSEVVFLKKPQFKSKLMGLQKVYQQSAILFDESDNLFNGYNYESKKLSEFDLEVETVIEKKYSTKPEREKNVIQEYNKKKESYDSTIRQTGYCIRTGVEIDFNPARPFCYNAYKSWVQFENYDYPENYCHKTGQPSNGRTSMANPVLD